MTESEIQLKRIRETLVKDSENKLAAQIVLIAKQLGETNSNTMHQNIIEAVNFIAHAKTQMGRLFPKN